jgi:hypothetical protein
MSGVIGADHLPGTREPGTIIICRDVGRLGAARLQRGTQLGGCVRCHADVWLDPTGREIGEGSPGYYVIMCNACFIRGLCTLWRFMDGPVVKGKASSDEALTLDASYRSRGKLHRLRVILPLSVDITYRFMIADNATVERVAGWDRGFVTP